MPTNPLGRAIRYLNWLCNPWHGMDAASIYELLATSSPTEHGLYLNLGYWRQATSVDQASDALAMLVAETGRMDRDDRVLDCGFGFGDQDILWAQRCEPQQIVGLNITESQVRLARRRIAAAGLAERVDLRHGSATAMPLSDASFDLVVALESAFHYRTREQFFREAWRVLRPGGRLATADIIPMPTATDRALRRRQRVSWGLVAGKFAIPAENVYTQSGYRAALERSGFGSIRIDSIREHVYAPLHRHLRAHPERLKRLHPIARLPARMTLRSRPESVYAGLDYVLVEAIKPKSAVTARAA